MRAVLLALVMALPAASALAQASPRIATTLDPADGAVVVGQPVQLHVRVLFADDMAHPPLVSVPEAPGAQIMRFESQALTVRDQIDGQAYVGKDFAFTVYPRRAGDIAIPAPRVTLLDRAGDPAGEARGTPTHIHARVPPGLDASGPVLVSSRVAARQEWSPDGGAKPVAAGGAIVRVIHRQADGTPALAMADFRFVAPDGVRVYVDPPVSHDQVNRGDVTGKRTDKVTYVFEKPGRYALPALVQPWWDPGQGAARSLTLPGLEVTVTAAAAGHTVGAGFMARLASPRVLMAVAGVILVAVVALLLAPRLWRSWRDLRRRRRAGAGWARRAAIRAARTGDARTAWTALATWLERLPVAEARALRNDASLAPSLARLERALFHGDGAWAPADGAALARAIQQARAAASGQAAGREGVLPALNPRA